MAEYIDRQEIIKKLEELDSRLMRGHYYDECEGVTIAKAIVQSVPAAGIKPVVHGKWFKPKYEYHVGICSLCGYVPLKPVWGSISYNYCPNCGAKMDGEEHDNV